MKVGRARHSCSRSARCDSYAAPLVGLKEGLKVATLGKEIVAHVWVEVTEYEALHTDAERYRKLRRGQHWSVVNGAGDELRAEQLDAAVDAVPAVG
jgi:hypothetical protein